MNTSESAIRYPRQFSQIRQMVEAQNGLNVQAYSTHWLQLGSKADSDPEVWDYPLAAAQEIAEFLNSWSYAWWSTKVWPITEPADRANCLTELVDAWHFLVSQALIEEDGDIYRAATALANGYALCSDAGVQSGHRQVVRVAKKMASYLMDYAETTAPQVMIYSKFFELLTAAGFSLDHFHARYNAKLQLNIFRQFNGYKDKPRSYVKEWKPGQEDNYFLAAWIDGLFADMQSGAEVKMPTNFQIMSWIAATYAQHTGKQPNHPVTNTDEETE